MLTVFTCLLYFFVIFPNGDAQTCTDVLPFEDNFFMDLLNCMNVYVDSGFVDSSKSALDDISNDLRACLLSDNKLVCQDKLRKYMEGEPGTYVQKMSQSLLANLDDRHDDTTPNSCSCLMVYEIQINPCLKPFINDFVAYCRIFYPVRAYSALATTDCNKAMVASCNVSSYDTDKPYGGMLQCIEVRIN